MSPLPKDTNQIQITSADINELMQTNPLAAQQLTAITWHRIALELEAQLAKTTDAFFPELESEEPQSVYNA